MFSLRCPSDLTVEYHSAPSVSAQRFSLEAFRFIADYPFVFVHCHVTVCNATDPDSQCVMNCPSSGLARRSVNDEVNDMYSLVQGPLYLVRGKQEETRENSLESSGTYTDCKIALFIKRDFVTVEFIVSCFYQPSVDILRFFHLSFPSSRLQSYFFYGSVCDVLCLLGGKSSRFPVKEKACSMLGLDKLKGYSSLKYALSKLLK